MALTVQNSDYDLWDAWLHKIYETTQQENWFMPAEETLATGVAMRVEDGFFRVFPYENPLLIPFEAAVRKLNPVVAVKIRNAGVQAAIRSAGPDDGCLYIDNNTRIQILDSIDQLPEAEKDQCGAFIRDDRSVVLWAYSLDNIMPLCKDFGDKLIKHIWKQRDVLGNRIRPQTPSLVSASASVVSAGDSPSIVIPHPHGGRTHFQHHPHHPSSLSWTPTTALLPADVEAQHNEDSTTAVKAEKDTEAETQTKNEATVTETQETPKAKSSSFLGWWRLQPRRPSTTSPANADAEENSGKEKRKLVLIGPIYAGFGAGLAAYFCSSGVAVLLEEYALDGDPTRFILLVTLPVIYCVSIFFCLQLIGNLCLILGPVAQYHENSAYYSAIKPPPNDVDECLPHITIQMPVYKESLELTIAPSVFSVKKAMQTYARQGGTSAIFICDDGLQVIDEEDRKERIKFYANHNIGWVARPGHDSKPGGFKRAGKFKKASNMNYGNYLSLKLETHLAALLAQGAMDTILSDGTTEYVEDRAMKLAQEEIFAETGGNFKPLCANGKSLRIGEIILIIDSDTVVPVDCFRDAAREMHASPDVAIIQHESDVLQVAHHYFENGITHFTRRINKCISLGCANGEVAPFVGHNAFLRWSAVQDASFIDEADGKRKQWSESNVSEDFDLALRLLLKGYNLRWATYSEGGFKEGVSLTVVDELARWQKYAYGCSEIIFNPLVRWWRMGPISKQLKSFVWSNAPVHYKIGMMSYMFSYYGIAAATVGSLLNYILLSFAPQLDRFYLHSFEILLACTVVFPGIGNVGYTLLEYRLGHRGLFGAFFENIRWVPFFVFFFGGLSIHLSTAMLAHLFSYDMTWGSTGKEVERSTFWIEVPRIWQRFRLSFIVCFACIAMMVVFTTDVVPYEWQVPGWHWPLIIPLALVVGCHILFPIVLNPWLMIFSY